MQACLRRRGRARAPSRACVGLAPGGAPGPAEHLSRHSSIEPSAEVSTQSSATELIQHRILSVPIYRMFLESQDRRTAHTSGAQARPRRPDPRRMADARAVVGAAGAPAPGRRSVRARGRPALRQTMGTPTERTTPFQ